MNLFPIEVVWVVYFGIC